MKATNIFLSVVSLTLVSVVHVDGHASSLLADCRDAIHKYRNVPGTRRMRSSLANNVRHYESLLYCGDYKCTSGGTPRYEESIEKCFCPSDSINQDAIQYLEPNALQKKYGKRSNFGPKLVHRQATSTITGAVSISPVSTYVPPPKTDVTPELIQQSLDIEPQRAATVSSVIPHFADGVISFLIQLTGPIAQTLVLNATDSLPCDTIGTEPQPNIVLLPKNIKNATSETVVPNCLIIAVNKYDPEWITYWIQRQDGSIVSLLGDNNVHNIDQLDTSESAALIVRAAPADQKRKRNLDVSDAQTPVIRRQVVAVDCGNPCPFQHMTMIHGTDGYCGCVFDSTTYLRPLMARDVEPPTAYTATMSPAACAAMSCINNDNKPALFNPFSLTCWCASPTYIETTNNAHIAKM